LCSLEAGIRFAVSGAPAFHGFLVAGEIAERTRARHLTSHGTLYKALDRLRKRGFLESEWEAPELAANERRPRRRLYRVTATGEAAYAAAVDAQPRVVGTAIQEPA
jgi:DNA-binding PadR family transcriptional regulator